MFALAFLFALAAQDVDAERAGDSGVDDTSERVVLRAPPGTSLVAVARQAQSIYVVDSRAIVHTSHDGGRSFRVGRFPARRSMTTSMFEAVDESEPSLPDIESDTVDELDDPLVDDGEDALDDTELSPEGIDPFALQQAFGYVGNNVWLDIGSGMALKTSAGELFAFPYGTTGEAYLEFTPDSPAFWDPQWINGLRRPDIHYADTAAPASPVEHEDDSEHEKGEGEHEHEDEDEEGELEQSDVRIVVDALDPRVAELHGPFGIERTDDGGATWYAADALERVPDPAVDPAADDARDARPPSDGDVTLTERALMMNGAAAFDASSLATLRKLRERGPTVDAIVQGARERFAPRVDDGGGLAALLPRIDIVGGGLFATSQGLLDAVFLDATFAGDADFVRQTAEQSTDNGEKAAFVRDVPYASPFAVVFLKWDLPSLFAPASTPREHRAAREAWRVVEREIVEAIEMRDAALFELASLNGSESDDAIVDRTLALQESEARLSALSGVTFPKVGGPAAKALARSLPEPEAIESVVARAQDHLRVGDDDVAKLTGGAAWRAVVPELVVTGMLLDTSLDEFDFLDEIGIDIPWVSKSANGRILEARARLSWDLPTTLRHDAHAARNARSTLAQVRKEIALATINTYFERRRAQAAYARAPRDSRFDEGLVVDELTAILAGLAGPNTGGTK